MHLPIFYSAMLLTIVNLLLRLAGTVFQVYLSGRIGAAGIGLLQLVMSVNALAVVAGIAGIRTASMYLTAEEIGKKCKKAVSGVLSGCMLYSILFSCSIAGLLYTFAPVIASEWISYPETASALRLFAMFLPVICLCNVFVGYFTAANRIGTLAAVEVAEQLISIVITLWALSFHNPQSPIAACQSVILGSSSAACFTLLCLFLLRLIEVPESCNHRLPMVQRLADTALPLAMADILKSGINTVENLMVPKRLSLHALTPDPLAAFGVVSGMVFPVLMFPACILFSLAELLIPELARCSAAKSRMRISYLLQKTLRIAFLYALIFCGLEFLLADYLCISLYDTPEAGKYLKLYALLIPILYCDAMTDAMTKGLGQQKICVRYNILTSAMDVVLLWFLLPKYGMMGYYVSFTLTHGINFFLSLRLLLTISGESIPFSTLLFAPAAMVLGICGAGFFSFPIARSLVFLLLLGSLWCLMNVTGWWDLLWLKSLVHKK